MPASGCLGIKTCPQGACSSISTAVGTGSGSLSALSVSAGKSAPHAMSEFYSYTRPWKCIYVGGILSSGCGGALLSVYQAGCLVSTPALSAGECYCACIGYSISVYAGNGGSVAAYINCNSVNIFCRLTTTNCTGSVSFPIKNTDTFQIGICANTPSCACAGCAGGDMYINTITSISGNECYGGGCTGVHTFTG